MSDVDPIHKRGHALEDEFFHRVDEKLREQLQAKLAREKSSEAIAEATGLRDPKLLNDLVEAGFQSTTLAALALVPAIFVAWADGSVTEKERQTVMSDALNRGLDRQTVAFQLIEHWLSKRPAHSLWTLWKEYAAAVYLEMSPSTAKSLAAEILQQATAVARASGGALGIGKVSPSEQSILDEIASVAKTA
ncbi:MAG: hypothetical protein ACO1RT_05485 [Planctomycetaceae bacterium]